MSQSTTALLELRHYYQNVAAQAEYQSAQAKAQIEHIDALLVNGLLQAQETPVLNAAIVPDIPVLSAGSPSSMQEDAEPTLPSLKVPDTKSKPKASAEPKESASRVSLPLLPIYEGMKKLDAIGKAMANQAGQVLHQDTIIQLLFGELSPADLKAERLRMKTILLQGVKKGLWEKAPNQPSSYLFPASGLASATPSDAPVRKGRKPTAKKEPIPTKTGTLAKSAPKASPAQPAKQSSSTPAPKKVVASRGRVQVLSLPAKYEGLSKIEAVAKLLEENFGKVMHIEEIIEQMYGKLAGKERQAERVRMKDVMTRGVKRKLWSKAQGVPSSIVLGEPSQPLSTAVTQSSARKTKNSRVKKTSPSSSKR